MQRGVLGELALRLGERGLVGSGVDLGEEIAGLDQLALLEADAHQLAGDLGADGHGGERRHRAERVDGDRHVAARRPRRRGSVCGGGRGFVGRLCLLHERAGRDLLPALPDQDRGGGQQDERTPQPQPAPALAAAGGDERGTGRRAGWTSRIVAGSTFSFISLASRGRLDFGRGASSTFHDPAPLFTP